MPDQQVHACSFGRFRQFDRCGQRVRDRLLDQHMHAAADAGQAAGEMVLVGGGDDRGIGPHRIQHLRRVVMPGNAMRFRHRARGGRGIGDANEARLLVSRECRGVGLADDAGADQGDAECAHAESLFWLCPACRAAM